MREPRDPLLKVLTFNCRGLAAIYRLHAKTGVLVDLPAGSRGPRREATKVRVRRGFVRAGPRGARLDLVNDPSAGSPTETLLRLLLPLSDKVYLTSHS